MAKQQGRHEGGTWQPTAVYWYDSSTGETVFELGRPPEPPVMLRVWPESPEVPAFDVPMSYERGRWISRALLQAGWHRFAFRAGQRWLIDPRVGTVRDEHGRRGNLAIVPHSVSRPPEPNQVYRERGRLVRSDTSCGSALVSTSEVKARSGLARW